MNGKIKSYIDDGAQYDLKVFKIIHTRIQTNSYLNICLLEDFKDSTWILTIIFYSTK